MAIEYRREKRYNAEKVVRQPLFDDDELLHHFRYYDEEKRITLGGRVTIITVEMAKLSATLQKDIAQMSQEERWAVFFKYSTDISKRPLLNQILMQEEGIAMAAQTLLTVSRDEVERARLLSEYKFAVDLQSDMIHAKREGREEGREEGRAEGHAEGRAEGHAEGHAEGRAVGHAEGRVEEKYKVARNMLADNMDVDLVAKYSNLTVDEIRGLIVAESGIAGGVEMDKGNAK